MDLRKRGLVQEIQGEATVNNKKLTYLMQLLVLNDDYSYSLDNNYNYFTVLLGELAVDSITF